MVGVLALVAMVFMVVRVVVDQQVVVVPEGVHIVVVVGVLALVVMVVVAKMAVVSVAIVLLVVFVVVVVVVQIVGVFVVVVDVFRVEGMVVLVVVDFVGVFTVEVKRGVKYGVMGVGLSLVVGAVFVIVRQLLVQSVVVVQKIGRDGNPRVN